MKKKINASRMPSLLHINCNYKIMKVNKKNDINDEVIV